MSVTEVDGPSGRLATAVVRVARVTCSEARASLSSLAGLRPM